MGQRWGLRVTQKYNNTKPRQTTFAKNSGDVVEERERHECGQIKVLGLTKSEEN